MAATTDFLWLFSHSATTTCWAHEGESHDYSDDVTSKSQGYSFSDVYSRRNRCRQKASSYRPIY
jgi:hypothetical protein